MHNIFPIISPLKLLVAMETSFFLSNLPQITLSPTRMMLHIKFHQDWLTGLRDIQVNIFSIISLWKKNCRSRACNSEANSLIWPKIELIRDFMHVLFTFKFEEDPVKNEGANMSTFFFTLKATWPQRYLSLKVWMTTTNRWCTISSTCEPTAQVS